MLDDLFEIDECEYDLIYQLRRAGIGVPANVAEGVAGSNPAGPAYSVRMARIAQAEMRRIMALSKQEYAQDPEPVMESETSVA